MRSGAVLSWVLCMYCVCVCVRERVCVYAYIYIYVYLHIYVCVFHYMNKRFHSRNTSLGGLLVMVH